MRRDAWSWPTRWRWPRAASRAWCLDFATLTGACVYALTERMSGLLANNDALADAALAAGTRSGERLWRFPLPEDYDTDIESQVADVAQCSVEGKGDHILAARFPAALHPKGNALGSCGPVFFHATRWPGAGAQRNYRFRCALCAVIAAGWKAAVMSDSLRIRQPDDWHLHLRDGAALAAVLPHRRAHFARAIVMPNLQAAGDHHRRRSRYRDRILARAAGGRAFEPLMTLYLTDRHATGRDRRAAREAASCTASSSTRPGATTHSDAGVHRLARLTRCSSAMEERGPAAAGARRGDRPGVDVFDREARFIDDVLAPLRPALARAARRARARHHRARPSQFVRGAATARRGHAHAAAPAAEPQRAVRRRHPPAPLLPAGAQARDATAQALLDGRDQRRPALLPRHRQRAACAPRQGDGLRLRRHLLRACRARALRRGLRGRRARWTASRPSPADFGAALLRPAAATTAFITLVAQEPGPCPQAIPSAPDEVVPCAPASSCAARVSVMSPVTELTCAPLPRLPAHGHRRRDRRLPSRTDALLEIAACHRPGRRHRPRGRGATHPACEALRGIAARSGIA